MVNERAYIAAEREATIRAHDCDEDGYCTGCKKAEQFVAYPCGVRLLAEQAADALHNRSTRWPAKAEES